MFFREGAVGVVVMDSEEVITTGVLAVLSRSLGNSLRMLQVHFSILNVTFPGMEQLMSMSRYS